MRRTTTILFFVLALATGLSLLPATPARAATISADAENVAPRPG